MWSISWDRKNVTLGLFLLFSVVGFVLAMYLTMLDYGATSGEFCSISESVNCEAVSQSKYAKMLGIPVAVFGMIAYAGMFAGMVYTHVKKDETVLNLVGTMVLVALAFSLYLTAVEAFILHAWCILCVGSQISVLIMTVNYFLYRKERMNVL